MGVVGGWVGGVVERKGMGGGRVGGWRGREEEGMGVVSKRGRVSGKKGGKDGVSGCEGAWERG
jgi:hypothetical protein